MNPHEETVLSHNLERIANALERHNELAARRADMAFLQLTTNDQTKIERWGRERHDANMKLPGLAFPRTPVES